jgi:WD40 repeat protein
MVQGRIIKRLLGQPANDNGSDSNLSFESRVDRTLLRPSTTQSASYQAGAPLSCLIDSPTGSHAIVAGEKVFKTVKINGTSISEEHDLRAAISNNSRNHDTLSAFNDQLNINTVVWGHGVLDTTIVTASANGRITLYDLNRLGSGLEVGRIREHARQVHKLSINPHRPTWLLSASQDGTAKLFDIKAPAQERSGQFFRSWVTFKGNADAVRDIKWSHSDGFFFACSTASGAIQYWDSRKNSAPVLKFNAHDTTCMSISWHPDGKHLVSGGFDQRCHVWDLSESADKRQKPKYTFSTPAPVSVVSWRPGSWSASAQARRAAQVAVVYDDMNPVKTRVSTVHIWDLARPSLPYKELADFESSPTGLLWHDRDLLWSVGQEGEFVQSDVAFSHKVIDSRSLSTFDFSPSGDLVMLLEERRGRQRTLSPTPSEVQPRVRTAASQSPSGNTLGTSKSDSDEDVVGSFLGGKVLAKKTSRRQSARSVNSISTTPPSIHGIPDSTVMDLDDAVQVTGAYKPQQTMAIGHAPSSTNRNVYQYLSSRYLLRVDKDTQEMARAATIRPALPDRISSILDHFALCAETVGHFRLAQTWKIISYAMRLLLVRRAQHHRELRLMRVAKNKAMLEKQGQRVVDENPPRSPTPLGDDTPRKPQQPKSPTSAQNPAMKSIISEEIESTSNVNTPLARPVIDSKILDTATSRPISSVDNDQLSLPPAAHSSGYSPKHVDLSLVVEEPSSSLDGYDFYDIASMATPAINIAAPQRKPPFRLDFDSTQHSATSEFGSLARHDSGESFQMFSTSGESHRTKPPSSTDSAGQGSPSQASQMVQDIESSWDSSAASDPRHHRSFGSGISSNLSDSGRYNLQPMPSQSVHRPILRPEGRSDSPFENVNNEFELGTSGIVESTAHFVTDIDESSLDILDVDYLPHEFDPPFVPGPIDPYVLIKRTVQFELQTGCLNAAVIILVLKPLLNPGVLDDIQAAAILRQYHHRLTGMNLFSEAALLRKLCYPTYRSTYSQGSNDITIGYICTSCNSPMGVEKVQTGVRISKCKSCRSYLESCTVCQLDDEPPENIVGNEAHENEPKNESRRWWWCQGCGHGGHTPCMQTWHKSAGFESANGDSEGCCPAEGCLHPCVPGVWRDEFIAEKKAMEGDEMNKLIKESRKGLRSVAPSVRRDSRDVVESRAVESVRGVLGVVGAGTTLERKKSVKVIAPGEER